MKIIKIITLLFCGFIYAKAQVTGLKQFTINNGLPINNVYCAAQDADGFMWFGTDFGIVKFDGQNFTHYYTKDGMINKVVTSMVYAGGDSLIFVSYPDALQAIHTNGRISTINKNYTTNAGIIFKNNNTYILDKRADSSYIEYKNNTFNNLNINTMFKTSKVLKNSLIVLPNGALAFCTNNGLYILINNVYVNILPNHIVSFGIYASNNTIVVATNKGIYSINQQYKATLINNTLPANNNILHMAQDGNNDIWLRDITKGIYKLHNNTLTEASKSVGLENKIVNKFFKDAVGNFWLCTSSEGIILLPNLPIKNYNTTNGMVNNNVLKLQLHNNKLWVGTQNGISILNNNTITTLPVENKGLVLNYVFSFPKINNNEVSLCLRTPFLSTNNITKYTDFTLQKKLGNYNVTLYNGSFAYLNKQNNILLFNGQGGINILTPATKQFKNYTFNNFGIRKVFACYETDSKIWIGTDRGILVTTNYADYTLIDTIDNQKIKQVFDFKLDAQNKLWIATDNGIYTYTNSTFTTLQKGETVGSNYCTKLLLVNNNLVLVATWDGILKITNNNISNISTSLGLASRVVNDILYNPNTNQYYAATDNGLSQFSATLLDTLIALPKVFIAAQYLTNNIQVPFYYNNVLAANYNNVSFNFATPYYQGIADVIYEYNLNNNGWLTTKTPNINFNNLKAGEHNLQVRFKLASLGQVSSISTFSFTIKAPFYKKWWFILGLFLALQFLFIYIITQRNKKIAAKKITELKKLNEQASLKQQAFTALLNPHFIFNSLNSIQHFINQQDRENANRYLSNFATLIRRNFEGAQQQFIPLETEIENIRLYLQLEQMRFGNKIKYYIELHNNVDTDDWMLPTLILQPFVENALLHGLLPLQTNGQLIIKFMQIININNLPSLQITIADNGVGMQKTAALQQGNKHNSKGMQLIKERLSILSKVTNAHILLTLTNNNNTQPNPGTCITLIYPLAVYDTYVRLKN